MSIAARKDAGVRISWFWSVVLTVVLELAAVSDACASSSSPPVPALGVAWYPEQWPESSWDRELALMERAHIRFVRMGEFAWSKIEPREGRFELDWLDRAIRAAERHHIQVVLGTPTAAPPAWLTSAHPEMLRVLPDGSRAKHGGRHQADFASAPFQASCRAIVKRMAERFGHDANVIGWQIDNEIGTDDRSEDTRSQFQTWLKGRFQSLDALNARWSTAYWSQTYDAWAEVPLPERLNSNPGLMLAWRQFVSVAYRDYVHNQTEVLRRLIDPRQRITTNYWIDARAKSPDSASPDADDLDLYTVSQDLDFASWDAYVGTGHLDPERFGLVHDTVRGLLGKSFWVMETQPGTVNWSAQNNSLDKGEVRAMAWHAVSHGADAVAYWQWRAAPNGQEQYHGTLLGADGTPAPVYEEVRQVGQEFSQAAAALAGTQINARVAILNDYPSRWAIGWQRFAKDFISGDALASYYVPLHALARSVDVVSGSAPLDGYRLLVAPALNVLDADTAAKLIAYVKSGGHLVLGARSAMKDGDNTLWPQRQPGPLAALLGARVVQWYALEHPVAVNGIWGSGERAPGESGSSLQHPTPKSCFVTAPETVGWKAGRRQ